MMHKLVKMSLAAPPTSSGIYAIKEGDRWLYVGRSKNIACRIKAKKHPVQITKDLESLSLPYWWIPLASHLASFEIAMIKRYKPEWNGCTSFEGAMHHGPACQLPPPMTKENQQILLAALMTTDPGAVRREGMT